MADEVEFQNASLASPPSGTKVDTEEIATKKVQRIKMVIGASGVDDGDVESANPLPVRVVVGEAVSDLNTLPISIVGSQNPERRAWISPDSSLTVNTVVRLVGTNFDGSIKDPNFWIDTPLLGGLATQNGGISLATNTTPNGSISYQTLKKARFVIGSPLKFMGFFAIDTAPVANNIRRCGAYSINNGFFFQLLGTAFSIGTRNNVTGSPVDTLVANGTFNGNYGLTWNPVVGEHYKFEIEYGEFGVSYYVNDILLHKIYLPSTRLVNILTLPARIENVNYNNNAVNSVFYCGGMAILRQGPLQTSPRTKYLEGPGTFVLKYGAGDIHSIYNNDNVGSAIIYDGISAAGIMQASIDLVKVLGMVAGGVEFSDGLTVVIIGLAKITVNYE